jgi:hypothetical protein
MMWLGTIYYTESTKKILDWFAGHARSDLRSIASLAIQVALETLICNGIWIVTKRAVRNTVRSIPLFLLQNDQICHVERSLIRAIRVTFTIRKEWEIVLAYNTVFDCCSIAETTGFVTTYISYLYILVPF